MALPTSGGKVWLLIAAPDRKRATRVAVAWSLRWLWLLTLSALPAALGTASDWLSRRAKERRRRGYNEISSGRYDDHVIGQVPCGVELQQIQPTISWTNFEQDQERQARVRAGLEEAAPLDQGVIESEEFMRFRQELYGAASTPPARSESPGALG